MNLTMFAPDRWDVLQKHLKTPIGLHLWEFKGWNQETGNYYYRHQDTGRLLIFRGDDSSEVNQSAAIVEACRRAGI